MILRRYITKQVAITTGIVLGFLVVVLLGGRLIKYFGIAAEGNLNVGLLFNLLAYNLPYFLELILPLSFFIALMLVFGQLYVDHEMAVINGCGISRGRIARLIIPLIIVLFVVEASLSVVGKPWGRRNSESIWQQQALSSVFDLIKPGQFISNNNYHLYVGDVVNDGTQLQDIVLIQTEQSDNDKKDESVTSSNIDDKTPDTETVNNQLNSLDKLNLPAHVLDELNSTDTIILAKKAQQVVLNPESGMSQLDLFNGRRYEVSASNQQYNQVGFQRYRITLTQPKKESVDKENIETQPIEKIWMAATSSQNSQTLKPNYAAQAELGYRLSLPWLIILAPMFAVPLAQVRPRQGRWLRLIPSILLFTCVALSIISLKKPISEEKISVWSNLWVIILLMAAALYLNWASRINQRIRFGFLGKHKAGITQLTDSNGGQE